MPRHESVTGCRVWSHLLCRSNTVDKSHVTSSSSAESTAELHGTLQLRGLLKTKPRPHFQLPREYGLARLFQPLVQSMIEITTNDHGL
jgi:hypothetical protein